MKNHRLGRWVPFFSGYPIIPARYFSGIRSGTRRRSARWGISSPPYQFGMPSYGFPAFPSVIYRICLNSIRNLQSFPRSKGRRAIPHGGACPPLLFRRKNRRVSRGFRCPSPSAFFPAFSFAFHSAPSCQSSFFRSASVSLRGQVAVPSWEPGGVFSCPECLSAKESGNCAAVTVRHT